MLPWLLVFFMANPGGVTEVFVQIPNGRFYYFDIFFLLSFAVVFGPFNANLFFKNKTAREFFLFCCFSYFIRLLSGVLLFPRYHSAILSDTL